MSPWYAYPATLHLVFKPGDSVVSVVVTGGLVGVTGASVVTVGLVGVTGASVVTGGLVGVTGASVVTGGLVGVTGASVVTGGLVGVTGASVVIGVSVVVVSGHWTASSPSAATPNLFSLRTRALFSASVPVA